MKTKYLNEVAEIRAGNSAPQGEEPFNNGRYNFYRTFDVGQVKQGEISESRDKVNKETYSNLKTFQINTILFPKSGASTFNNNRVIIKEEGAIASHLAGIKANPEVLNDYYLYYFLLTIDAKNLVQDSAYPSVNLKQISQIKIPVPSLQEQEEIVERLDKIFVTLKAKRKTNVFLIIKLKQLFNSKINKDFHGQKNIDKIVNFTDAVEVINKDAVKKRDYLESGKYPIVAQEKFLINGYTNNNKNIIKSPIPLIGFGDHTKVVKFLNFPFVKGADGLKVLKVNQDILPKYFYWWLKGLNLRNLGYARHFKLLKKYKIEVIPLKNQKEIIKNIDELANNLGKIIENYHKSNKNIDLLRKSVLNKEFSYE